MRRKDLVERTDQSVHMMIEIPATIDRDRLPISEILQGGWKLIRFRHSHATNENWYQRNVSSQRCFHFHPHRIGFVVDSTLRTIGAAEPSWPDNDKQNIRGAQRIGDLRPKIDARPNIVDVAKDGMLPKLLGEAVKNPPSDILGIRAAIRNGYLWHESARKHA